MLLKLSIASRVGVDTAVDFQFFFQTKSNRQRETQKGKRKCEREREGIKERKDCWVRTSTYSDFGGVGTFAPLFNYCQIDLTVVPHGDNSHVYVRD